MIKFVAHRGNINGTHGAAENSIAALDAVVKAGCSLMEIDVRLTSDRAPVCWHDHDVEINGGRTPIINVPLSELKRVHPNTCTFPEMLDAAAEKGVRLVVEMKNGMAGVRGFCEDHKIPIPWFDQKEKEKEKEKKQQLGIAVATAVKKHLKENAEPLIPRIITCYESPSIIAARDTLGKSSKHIYFTKMYWDLPEEWQKKFENHKFDGINLRIPSSLTEHNFKALRKIRDELYKLNEKAIMTLFTVNNLEMLAMFSALPKFQQPDYIITDYVSEALQQQQQFQLMQSIKGRSK